MEQQEQETVYPTDIVIDDVIFRTRRVYNDDGTQSAVIEVIDTTTLVEQGMAGIDRVQVGTVPLTFISDNHGATDLSELDDEELSKLAVGWVHWLIHERERIMASSPPPPPEFLVVLLWLEVTWMIHDIYLLCGWWKENKPEVREAVKAAIKS